MKTISRIILGLFLISLIACSDEEQATTAYGDAFILIKKTEQDTLMGLALHAVSNKTFQSVSASPVENIDVSYTLSSNQGYKYDFYYETSENNFATELPQTGDYNFSAIMENGENITFSDDLLDDIVYPPVLVSCVYNTTDDQIDIEWEEDDDVDIFGVKLYDDQERLVFLGTALNSDATEFSIDKNTAGWANGVSPDDGDTYTVVVDAYLYEPIKQDLNLQCKASTTHEVIWGND